MRGIAEVFFSSENNQLFLWIAGGVGAALFLYVIIDALRHRHKKAKRHVNAHYTMTGRAEEWARRHPEDDSGGSSRKK